jgi:hypothetical protein
MIPMGIQDYLALTVVAVALAYAGRSVWRMLNGKTGCATNCGCGDKPAKAGAVRPPSRRLKRLPLVTLDQVGKPAPSASTDPSHLP